SVRRTPAPRAWWSRSTPPASGTDATSSPTPTGGRATSEAKSRRDGAREILLRQLVRPETDLVTDHAPGVVVGLEVDAAPAAREARLVGGVVVGRPLEDDVRRRADLEGE